MIVRIRDRTHYVRPQRDEFERTMTPADRQRLRHALHLFASFMLLVTAAGAGRLVGWW